MPPAPSVRRETNIRTWLNQYWSDLPLNAKGLIVVVTPLLALVLNFITSRLNARELIVASARLEETRQAQFEIVQIRASIVRADNAVLAYGISRRQELLEPYRAADKTLPGSIAGLFNRIWDDPVQVKRLRHVQDLLDQTRELVATMTREPARAGEPLTEGGKILVARSNDILSVMRGEVGAMEGEEDDLIARRTADVERTRNWDLVGDWSELGSRRRLE